MSSPAVTDQSVASTPRRPFWQRPVLATVALLALYTALAMINSIHGYLGTDTGAKVVTLAIMEDRGTMLDPQVGYWAEEWDPEGTLHPLLHTQRVGDEWVNVTTLPLILASRPLYELGGYRLALVFPMAGTIAAAFGARALAGRLGSTPRRGWCAFWAVGVASPLVVYAVDLWEHSLGVALLLWAVVALVDGTADRPLRNGLLAGLLIGAAASMRTEALAYGFVAVAAASLSWVIASRSWRRAVELGGGAVVGLIVAQVVNVVIEVVALGEPLRAGRAGGAAGAAAGNLETRAREAIMTTSNLTAASSTRAFVVGGLAVGMLALALWASRRPRSERITVLAGAFVAVLYMSRMIDDLGWVPGFLAASPLAVMGLVAGWARDRAQRVVFAIALAALPIVWVTQYTGGAGPQWGGRYVLTSGLLLLVVGVARWERFPRPVVIAVAVLAVIVSWYGAFGLTARSHQIASAGAWFADQPSEVLVWRSGFIPREFGERAVGQRWLVSYPADPEATLVDVIDGSGVDTYGVVQEAGGPSPPPVPGFEHDGRDSVDILGIEFTVDHYRSIT